MIDGLDDFKTYNRAMELGSNVWKLVVAWDSFNRDTIGKQLVRSCDSVAANLSEGLGRYHFKEIKNFSYYSRGSLFETQTWLTKAVERNLITNEQFDKFSNEITQIGKMINGYIKSIGNVNEPDEQYGNDLPNA
jgi:four helix bundle protein